MSSEHSRPEELILTHLPVPPCCIRPSVAMGVGAGSNEDDLTVIMAEIIKANATLQETMDKGGAIANVMEQWGYLQMKIAHYFNRCLSHPQCVVFCQFTVHDRALSRWRAPWTGLDPRCLTPHPRQQ